MQPLTEMHPQTGLRFTDLLLLLQVHPRGDRQAEGVSGADSFLLRCVLVLFYTSVCVCVHLRLRKKHGNDWATIGASLGRSASSVKDRCRLMKDTCNTGQPRPSTSPKTGCGKLLS